MAEGHKVMQIISQHTQQPMKHSYHMITYIRTTGNIQSQCMISGFWHGVNESFALLGWYAAWISFSYWHFQTTYQSHLQESSSPWRILDWPTLDVKGCPEVSVTTILHCVTSRRAKISYIVSVWYKNAG